MAEGVKMELYKADSRTALAAGAEPRGGVGTGTSMVVMIICK